VAATADICIALEKGILTEARIEILNLYLPVETDRISRTVEELLEASKDRQIIGDIGDLLSLPGRLKFALRITKTRLKQKRQASPRNSDISLADVWRHVANGVITGLILCQQVQEENGAQICDLTAITKLLEDVVADKSPCVGADGSISVPQWANRRSDPRYECELPVRVISRKSSHVGVLKDFSRSGLNIVGCDKFEIGEQVGVKRYEGATLNGFVRWAKNGQMGIQLKTRLTDDDPLFAQLREAKTL
jgi:hypothetical protein